MTVRTTVCIAAAVVATVAGTGLVPGGAAEAEEVCRTETVTWTSPSVGLFLSSSIRSYATGVIVAPPAEGEQLTVVASSWISYDRYPEGANPSRANHHQANERWSIAVGGSSFGGLTTDVPDTLDEGAETDWFSGLVTGSFGTGPIGSGEIVVRHASLAGFTESPNSVHPHQVVLELSYCRPNAVTTTTTAPPTSAPASTVATTITTIAATTSTEAATTTLATTTTSATPPTQTAAPTTTAVRSTTTIVPELATAPTVPASAAPTSTTITPAGPTLPTTVPTGPATTTTPNRLPETGSDVAGLLRLGGVLLGVGALMIVVRRRLVI